MNRLLLLLALVASPLRAADPLVLATPGIADGQVSSKKTASIEVVATNEERNTPAVFTWISVERKGADGKFGDFRTDIQCPCNARCKKPAESLGKGASLRATWDFLSDECKKAGPGVYRFAIIERYSEAIAGYVYHGVSKEFTITE